MLPDALSHTKLQLEADYRFFFKKKKKKKNQKQMLIGIFQNTPHLLTHGKPLPFKMLSSPREYRVVTVLMETDETIMPRVLTLRTCHIR